MKAVPLMKFCQERPLLIVLIGAITIAIGKAVATGLQMEDNFISMGNDDIMRLVMVRDWLAGQSWFDTTQYRLMPPEGVLIHWSRYIDAGIAAFIVPFSYFMPMEKAELIGAAIWPTVILILTLLVIGFGTKRLFGPIAASFAVLCTILWPLLSDLHAQAGNLDHHNIQILMMVIFVYAVVWPDRPVSAGISGGLAAAFALSTGLESLLFIVAGGIVLYGRCVFDPRAQTQRLLIAFSLALAAGSLVFWLGITAPALRALPVCDQLGTPMLSVIAIAVVAALAPLVLRGRIPGAVFQISATLALTGIGLAIAWPLLGPCVRGPYGDLPPELQEMIATRITEAKPFLIYVQTQLFAALGFMFPVVVALVSGTVLWWSQRGKQGTGQTQNAILGQLLLLGFFGIGVIFLQMRTVILVASVVPAIGGICLAALLKAYLQTRSLATAALIFIVAIGISAPQILLNPLKPFIQGPVTQREGANCRNHETLLALNDVPPAVIMNSTNMGAPLLWVTHHSTLSAPYHRSPDAFMNGVLGFDLEETAFEDLARNQGATHVLLCAGQTYVSDFLTGLAAGELSVAWLRPVPLSNDDQLLFAMQD
ncbi:hypothetical protein SAMN05421665_2824 [Yoonia rosea]|uniref:4-amino-4-deoxy-L-arabinose transferase n=1 Tax=Yoonia rosea TaxID=287098 RepID=A0A1R3XC63_9RHOB|nr:hypothetical protein [Yoonia rosea]SIT88883.1 hypothetical protein SAMN05421665_2824 [Yoonia rosea]